MFPTAQRALEAQSKQIGDVILVSEPPKVRASERMYSSLSEKIVKTPPEASAPCASLEEVISTASTGHVLFIGLLSPVKG